MEIDLFDYELPEELIAQEPLKERDKARMLVLKKDSGEIEHSYFYKLPNYLNKEDLLILNNTKVIKAKLTITLDTGGKLDALFLRGRRNLIEILCEKSKKLRSGRVVFFKDGTKGVVKDVLEEGKRVIEIEGIDDPFSFIEKIGDVPLPPYIKKKDIKEEDYQTIYAKSSGSIAAPTAGLHFTESLIENLKQKGVIISYITLHVGTPTFKPLKVKNIEEYKIGEEWIEINEDVVELIKKAKKDKKRVVAVGTTVVRALETMAQEEDLKPYSGYTNLFIKPSYEFKIVDSMITNFHLPKTSLLILVCAFAGRDKVINAYKVAIENRYRFYSFGDGMLIL